MTATSSPSTSWREASRWSRRGLKTGLAVLGAVFLVLLLLVGAFAIPLAIKAPRPDKESQAYAEEVIAAVCSDWDQAELESPVSPRFWDVASHSDVDRLFAVLKKLGALQSSELSQGRANITRLLGQEEQITAVYVTEAEFEEGPATITLTLVNEDDKWQVLGFRVDSMALLEE